MIYAQVGMSTFDGINVNLRILLGMDLAYVIFAVSLVCIGVAYWLTPNRVVLLSIVFAVLISITVSLTEKLLMATLPYNDITRWIYMALGLIGIPVGAAFMIHSTYPPSAVDTLIKSIHVRFGIKVGTAKYVTEIIFLAIAFSLSLITGELKSTIGIGTILLALSAGYILQFTMNFLKGRTKYEDK